MFQYIVYGTLLTTILGIYTFYKMTVVDIEIKIKKKYIKRYNKIEYIIMDSNSKIYKISPYFLKQNLNLDELWKNIYEGNNYRVKHFSINMPILNFYHQIIDIKPLH